MSTVSPQIGDLVCYRGGFGAGRAQLARVTGFGTKNDQPLVDLDNGHWAYLDQIDRVVEAHDFLSRVEALIAEGCDRGDAQAIVELQDERAGRAQLNARAVLRR